MAMDPYDSDTLLLERDESVKHWSDWDAEVVDDGPGAVSADGEQPQRRGVRISLGRAVRWSCTALNLIAAACLLAFLFHSFSPRGSPLPPPLALSSTPPSTSSTTNIASAVGPSSSPSCPGSSVLPSCSILNANLTQNLLHYSRTIQEPQVHADCADYLYTGMCVTSHAGATSPTPIRPQWLVFLIHSGPDTEGAGGLADRLKGLLTVLPLALLTGRAFAIHAIDYLPFSHIYGRGQLNWVEWEAIPAEVRAGSAVRLDNWYNHADHLMSAGQHNWRWEWRHSDIVQIRFNLNGFPDLMENQHLLPAYRAFGFHAATEKGDMDMYWECLTDFALTYKPAVTAVLNPLMQQIGRAPVLTWEESISRPHHPISTPTLPPNPYSRWLDGNGRPRAAQEAASADEAAPVIASTCAGQRLYCAQIRMGANGQQTTGNTSVGFSDTESFIGQSSFASIFTQLDSLIEQHQQRLTSSQPACPHPQPYALFITSDSNSYQSALPASWSGIPQLSVPGYTAHIDKLSDVMSQYDVVLAAYVKTVVTHYLLGECDVAAVSATGFGTTARWRTRNRQLGSTAFSARAYTTTHLIPTTTASAQDGSASAPFAPYQHRRGSGGREQDKDYLPMSAKLLAVVEAEVLTNPAVRAALNASLYNSYQASSELPAEPPIDPACRGRTVDGMSAQCVGEPALVL